MWNFGIDQVGRIDHSPRSWIISTCASGKRRFQSRAASMDSLPGVLTSQCAWRAKTGPSTGSAEMSSAASAEKWRSEEHTSELQSLMRISYAVFCLKKKNIY